MSFEIGIRGKYETDELYEFAARFLGIDKKSIGSLFESPTGLPVYIQLKLMKGSFDICISLHRDPNLCPHLREIDFALFLAEALSNDVLMSYWSNDPYAWIIVQPDGSLFKVDDIYIEENEDMLASEEIVLEINELSKEPLTLEEVRLNSMY